MIFLIVGGVYCEHKKELRVQTGRHGSRQFGPISDIAGMDALQEV